jgi:hypothetical protein
MVSPPQVLFNGTRVWADRLGVWSSALCVVHCLLMPLILSLSTVAAHFLPGEESTHRSLAVLVACFGAISLLTGFRRHRRSRVLLLMAAGLCCIAGAAWFGDELPAHVWEVGITFTGSGLMIAAHRLNHTFCRCCDCSADCVGVAPGAVGPGSTAAC